MSNIEDRDEKTYLNGFEEQTELPYDWDSEEAQGTKEELKAETIHLKVGAVVLHSSELPYGAAAVLQGDRHLRSRAYTDTDEYYSTTFGQSGVYDTTNDADVGYVTTSGQ